MKFILVCMILFISVNCIPQELKKNTDYYIAALGFWNVENLYDTLNDQWKNDEDFTPVGTNSWNGEKYRKKIEMLSFAISQIAKDASPDGLAILGLCEVENIRVVEDLVNSQYLKARNYKVILREGPDARGVDPALIYNPKYFRYKNSVSYPVKVVTDPSHFTRDILVVCGSFLEEPMSILVNHWPSRRGGEMASRPNRNSAATVVKRIADSIYKADNSTKIIIMGDLNDDPINESVRYITQSKKDSTLQNSNWFFNPMEKLFKDGTGSLAWQDSWNLFDQILLNRNLHPGSFNNWQFYAVRVFNKAFLRSDLPADKGYPFRTFTGPKYTAGYSDHFPVYVLLAKEKKR